MEIQFKYFCQIKQKMKRANILMSMFSLIVVVLVIQLKRLQIDRISY